jgi:hypothetical protein
MFYYSIDRAVKRTCLRALLSPVWWSERGAVELGLSSCALAESGARSYRGVVLALSKL